MPKRSRHFLVWLLVAATSAAAQDSFTPEQRVVIDQIERCYDAWSASVAEQRYERFAADCPHDEGSLWWYTNADGPGTFRQVWNAGSQAGIVKNTWHDMKPVAVAIDGDLALVHIEVTWQPSNAAGDTLAVPSRRLTVLRRRADTWVQVGGSIASMPAAAVTPTPSTSPDRVPSTTR